MKDYPLFLYIYNRAGRYSNPFQINSEEELLGLTDFIKKAIKSLVEVRITDSDDFLVFHAIKGKILFPSDISLGIS